MVFRYNEDDSEWSMMKGLVNPFAAVDIDFEKQTGADWYRLALAASYGGKAIHGLKLDLKASQPIAERCAKVRPKAVQVKFDRVLSTYDSEAIADAHARANGFTDFGAAFMTLGEGAIYDTEISYTSAAFNAVAALDSSFSKTK